MILSIFTNRLNFIIFSCAAFLLGCDRNESHNVDAPIKVSAQEMTGTNSQRIDQIEVLLKQYQPFPKPLENAHFLEEKIGDGILGPADYLRFYALTASSINLSDWVKTLKIIEQRPSYTAPAVLPPWWVTKQDFNTLKFYKLSTPSGEDHGWIGVSENLKKAYIFTFST